MTRVIVSPLGDAHQRSAQAFADAQRCRDASELSAALLEGASSLWLDLTSIAEADKTALTQRVVQLGPPVIVMQAMPSEADAFAALKAGAQGYCHLHAAPEQLLEIALVVEHGGLWMPPEIMQRFLAVSARVLPTPEPSIPALDNLTARELMVAEQVAHGASNREIAHSLDISERTVKSHLTVIFDKLGVRDRVQLALAMNNIPTYSTVN
jgi:DNA-binding NarL/FixJ family response regulator